jgi:hypothetical protein
MVGQPQKAGDASESLVKASDGGNAAAQDQQQSRTGHEAV